MRTEITSVVYNTVFSVRSETQSTIISPDPSITQSKSMRKDAIISKAGSQLVRFSH